MPAVNNVTRLLDAKGIPYSAYDTPVEKLGAVETAEYLHVPVGLVYKTIVVTRQSSGSAAPSARKKSILAVIPGNHAVDLKLLAGILGEKKVLLPTEKEAERLTGLQAGGISPLALINRGFQVVLDESAKSQDMIHVSGGQRGLNIKLRTNDLIELTRAIVGRISSMGN